MIPEVIKMPLALILFAILIGNSLGIHTVDQDKIVTNIAEKYGETREELLKDELTSGTPVLMVLKGMFMIAAGFAVLTVNQIGSADISPIIYVMLALLFLPIKQILALLWLCYEFIANLHKRLAGKRVSV